MAKQETLVDLQVALTRQETQQQPNKGSEEEKCKIVNMHVNKAQF